MAKILIADDDQAILDSTKLLLEYEGYEVVTASDGEMVKKLHDNLPDLILLDIWLSGTNGIEIAQGLLENAITKHIPIILFSANHDIEKIAKDTKVSDFLIKPFDINDMVAKIKKHLPKSP